MWRDLFVNTVEIVLPAMTTRRAAFVAFGLSCSALVASLFLQRNQVKSARVSWDGSWLRRGGGGRGGPGLPVEHGQASSWPLLGSNKRPGHTSAYEQNEQRGRNIGYVE